MVHAQGRALPDPAYWHVGWDSLLYFSHIRNRLDTTNMHRTATGVANISTVFFFQPQLQSFWFTSRDCVCLNLSHFECCLIVRCKSLRWGQYGWYDLGYNRNKILHVFLISSGLPSKIIGKYMYSWFTKRFRFCLAVPSPSPVFFVGHILVICAQG